jgi:transcriptional antiterminator
MSVFTCDYGNCPLERKQYSYYTFLKHLKDEHDFTIKRLAAEFNESESTIRRKIKKVENLLKEVLEEECRYANSDPNERVYKNKF